MVKHQKTTKKHASHERHVTLHHHHHKPYRKRHLGLFVGSLVGLIIVLTLLVQYRDIVMTGIAGSRNFISDFVGTNVDYDKTIQSSYGFAATFDSRSLYANAVDGETGKIFQDRELLSKRAYSKMQFAPLSQQNVTDQSAVSISYHPEISGELSSEALIDLVFDGGSVKKDKVTKVSTENEKIGGLVFEKSVWRTAQSVGPLNNLYISYSIYTSNINGHPLVITVNEGFVDIPGMHPQYDDLINSLEFTPQTARVNDQHVARVPSGLGDSLLDTLLMARTAAAATTDKVTSTSERIAALYSPAVVRVYNSYCMDVEFDKDTLLRDACLSSAGSGFFVGQDGYIATNGHVVSMDPQDTSVYNAFVYAIAGDTRLVNRLAIAAGFKQSDVPTGSSQTEALAIIADKLYELDKSRFGETNAVHNLLVATGSQKPDTKKLLSDTQARKKHVSDASIQAAVVKATDFRLIDGINGFHNSDVAIIKIDGKNFPIAKLGSIDDVSQGGELSILGFPGNANENGLVDSETSTVTLTTGKVSSIKNADGSDNRLIETDTTIGHGNSGGPAFSNSEEVIGIATYTLDGSGSGDGVYNYVRDVQDLIDLAKASDISFDQNSVTQEQWEEGIEFFYTAHYSKALQNFQKVKELYPSHNKVAEFIATSKKRIANGEDVQDFPVEIAIVSAIVLLGGVMGGLFMIIHHHKKHKVYIAGVAQGTVAPYAKGETAPLQHISVSNPTVQPYDKIR